MSNPDPQDLLKEIAELSGDLDTPLIGRDVTPPDAPPAMRKDMHTNNVIPQLGVNEMEPLGYLCLHGLDPNPAEVSQITAEFDEGQKLEEGPTAHIQGGQACYQVLQSGIWDPDIPDPVESFVERELGPRWVSQGPVILGHNPAADMIEFEPRLAHPRGDGGISFIRLVRGKMNTTVEDEDATIAPSPEAFVLYESSHSATHFSERHAPNIRPTATPDRLFILRGALRCKIKPPKGCVLVWIGFSAIPILETKRDPDTFPFMVNHRQVPLPPPLSRRGRSRYIDYRRTR